MTKTVLFDFDGVILDSMPVRDYGFRKVLASYPKNDVETLIAFHRENGGLSRFVKFRYFFENILQKEITEDELATLADSFSKIMKKELTKPKYLITETLDFIKEYHQKFNFHIVSGSEEKELQYLCHSLGIAAYFSTINGSPETKTNLINKLIHLNQYKKEEILLIGDSQNDYDAAKANQISFYGFNNTALKNHNYIYTYTTFIKEIM